MPILYCHCIGEAQGEREGRMIPLSSMSRSHCQQQLFLLVASDMVAAPSGVPHPYPDHPLKGNHAAWHAALNAHPFLLFFTSCSISTFLFITNLLLIPYETYPRGKHTGKTTHLQTDGLDRLLEVPSDPVVFAPLLGQHVVPLSVIRYPFIRREALMLPSSSSQSHSSLLSMDVSSTGCHTVVPAGYSDPVDRRSGPPAPPPPVGPTMFSDGSPSFSESNHR